VPPASQPPDFSSLALAIEARIGSGPRCIIIGSTSFWGRDSESLCTVIGEALASVENLVLVTGGVEGVGETTGRAFHRTRQQTNLPARIVHVLPDGEPEWDYGETLFAGTSMFERREVLGRIRGVFVAIEGGPGTAHEAEVALAAGATVIPVGRSGGVSAKLHPRLVPKEAGSDDLWRPLADSQAPHGAVASAVRELVLQAIRATD
jgi:predicted Rossmann-fold nucleotide-binding protein